MSFGFNFLGAGRQSADLAFLSRQKGKIFLQVEGAGEAWYVDPLSLKRYFLGRPADAFSVMRLLGLGISNRDINLIEVGSLLKNEQFSVLSDEAPINVSAIEQLIHGLINEQRANNGLPALKWNEEVAAVAREHSYDLAEENKSLSDLNKICNYALIHHEGKEFGLMPADRLNNRGVNYYSKAGENIALIGVAQANYLVESSFFNSTYFDDCQQKALEWNEKMKSDMENLLSESDKINRLAQEIERRQSALSAEDVFKISKINWRSDLIAAQESVVGWMNSPGHKANILDGFYDEAGVGVAYVNGYIIAIQVFIKRAVCGYENGPCCERNACYLPNSCEIDNICR